MKKEFYASINGTIKENIIIAMSRKYYRFLKRNDLKCFLNGEEVLPRNEVKVGDKIVYEFIDVVNKEENIFNYDLDIVFENEDFIVINKPAHLNTIPSRAEPIKSVYNALYTYLRNNNKLRTIHIITRLDKETSGLVLVALNKETAIYMNTRHKEMNKMYYAMVEGHVDSNHFIIEKPIKRCEVGMKREVSLDGSYAKTEVFLEKRIEYNDILKIKLYTGRTHQIRVHLSSLGTPIVGDELYGTRGDKMYLHCYHIDFIDNKGVNRRFEIIPEWGN